MPKWPGFAQNFVKAILGNADGPIDATNPLIVTPVSGGGGQSTVTADQGVPGATAWPVAAVGNVAAGAPDSGNPVKTGGNYLAVAPILDDGDRGDTLLDVNSNTKVTLGTLLYGEDDDFNRIRTEEAYSITWITTQTTTVVKSGAALLQRIIIPTPVATATVKVYNNTAASGAVLLETVTIPASPLLPIVIELGVEASLGITVVTGVATMAVGVVWQ